MKKIRYYIDTSVLNFVFADDSPERKQITIDFFNRVRSGSIEIFVSTAVMSEIEAAPEPRRTELRELIREHQPILLETDVEVEDLAGKYIAEGIIPLKYEEDAIHIAVATVNDLDVIVSWNFKHIVKVKTRREVNGVNRMLGYREIEIASPEEALEQ